MPYSWKPRILTLLMVTSIARAAPQAIVYPANATASFGTTSGIRASTAFDISSAINTEGSESGTTSNSVSDEFILSSLITDALGKQPTTLTAGPETPGFANTLLSSEVISSASGSSQDAVESGYSTGSGTETVPSEETSEFMTTPAGATSEVLQTQTLPLDGTTEPQPLPTNPTTEGFSETLLPPAVDTTETDLASTATTEARDATTGPNSFPRTIDLSTGVMSGTTEATVEPVRTTSENVVAPPETSTEASTEATGLTSQDVAQTETTSEPGAQATGSSTDTASEPIETTHGTPSTQDLPETTDELSDVATTNNIESQTISTDTDAPKVSSRTSEAVDEPATGVPDESQTVDEPSDTATKDKPGQTSTADEPEKTTASNRPTTTEDGIVTGTDGAVVTYTPSQDAAYSDFTGTTTTTDDGGAAIVIFPAGWIWKLKGNLPAGNLPAPPSSNPGGGVAGGSPGGEGDGKDGEDEDEKKSTKEEEKSTAESTAQSTTVATSEATTETTDECTATEIPDCTRTISYISTSGTMIICATGTQATATQTIMPETTQGAAGEYDVDEYPPEFGHAMSDELMAEIDKYWEDEIGDIWADATTTEAITSATETETPETSKTAESTDTTSPAISSEETTTTDVTTEMTSTLPNTLITTTRNTKLRKSSDTATEESTTSNMITSMPDSTAEAATSTTRRTNYPCVIRAGPDVETPYCNCQTTSDGERYIVTAPMVSDLCVAYTEFPMSLYTTEAPTVTEPAVIEEPFTETNDGTVLAYKSYQHTYFRVANSDVTATVGLGEASTISTPVPTQTGWNGDGSDICTSSDKNVRNALSSACDKALAEFEDDTIYDAYTSRYKRMGSILKVLTMGQAGCTVQFECEDYGIGMSGKDIKKA
ncbi:hypothetical protein F53441_8638 [Fusarium austroafricanum]|uniref:Uncharacterized protein n=1 Tax=Fusarium austroafricanum TaxID=2364996 RepID=A0A8H4NWD0_9HYPO|nr:hypothetical protein F53441_8638 [Fusarium austroafricanum]